MRNNRDRAGRGTYFGELEPLANAIGNLKPSGAMVGGNTLAERSYEESMRRVEKKNAKLARRAARASNLASCDGRACAQSTSGVEPPE